MTENNNNNNNKRTEWQTWSWNVDHCNSEDSSL